MAGVGDAQDSRWWRRQSTHESTIDATVLDGQIALIVTGGGASCARSLRAIEARYDGVDRAQFGGHGQILRVRIHNQLDVPTEDVSMAPWPALTGAGRPPTLPTAYGPGDDVGRRALPRG